MYFDHSSTLYDGSGKDAKYILAGAFVLYAVCIYFCHVIKYADFCVEYACQRRKKDDPGMYEDAFVSDTNPVADRPAEGL